MEAFTEVLESRKAGLGGCWFTAPGESSKDAFMRRLKRSDPSFAIFEAYAAEHTERWAGATALTVDAALKEMPEIVNTISSARSTTTSSSELVRNSLLVPNWRQRLLRNSLTLVSCRQC